MRGSLEQANSGATPGRGSDPKGYLHPRYARAFEEFGRPRFLPSSGGWILEREIPGSTYRDAMGSYPRFFCRNWSGVCADVEAAGAGLVSLLVVTDPFATLAGDQLGACFDAVRPYKEHHIVDLKAPAGRRTSVDHRYKVRRARRDGVTVERCEPTDHVDDWVRLYDVLGARHEIRGLKRFSRASFAAQLSVPGAVMFRAVKAGATVAAHVWYLHDDIAYSHLQATDQAGYEARAPYLLYAEELDWLAARCAVADVGASAGSAARAADGLAQFKRGWATDKRPSYLCTRIFDRGAYDELTRASGQGEEGYFPAYRSGELD